MCYKFRFVYCWLLVVVCLSMLVYVVPSPVVLASGPVLAQAETPTPLSTLVVTPTLIVQPVVTPTLIVQPVPDSLIGPQRQLSPEEPRPGEEATVSLSIKGEQKEACRGIPDRPADVLLVFDISTSAGFGPDSNWEGTVEMTRFLMEGLARPLYRSPILPPEASQVGLITSKTGTLGPEPNLLVPLTDDFALLRDQVNTLTPSGDTDIAGGLRLAAEELSKSPSDRAPAVILMLHDNVAVSEGTKAAVQEAKAQGVDVYLIANSKNIGADEQLALPLATQLAGEEQALLDPSQEQLQDLFIAVTKGNKELAAKAVEVAEIVSPAEQVSLSNVTDSGGRIEGNQVIWQLPALEANETINLGYQLTLAPSASTLTINNQMTWLDCNGYPRSTSPELSGIGITPLPTTTPFAITTQSLTPTPAPGAASPVPPDAASPVPPDAAPVATETTQPIAPAVTPIGGSDNGLILPFLPSPLSDYWWVLLALLLLIPLFWWLWQWFSQRNRTPEPRLRRVRPRPRPNEPKNSDVNLKDDNPSGEEIAHDWKTEVLIDELGQPVNVRFSPPTKNKLIIRIDEERSKSRKTQLARATLILEEKEERDPITGHTSRLKRARIDEFESKNESDPQRGIDKLLLKKLEELASQNGAQEIYAPTPPEPLRSFLLLQTYHIQRREELELSKQLY